ncbi:MAG: S-layer homology domain-containing protein [Candidatus Abawacabacteria bacterium]|nr:S-layer homology domain-containing protein [Candidatus Abawacabacteria bacterium]
MPFKHIIAGTKVIAFWAIALLVTPLANAAFQDVRGNDWFYPYTEQLVSAGIIANNQNFFPFRSITRAELAKMATKAAEYQRILSLSPAATTFCDVEVNNWSNTFVQTLFVRGAVQGSSSGCAQRRMFHPNNSVTRAEALKILLGVYGIAVSGNGSSFSDIAGASWYAPYVTTAASIGLINNGGSFRPHANLTRAEMSKIIVKLTEYIAAHPEVANRKQTGNNEEDDENEGSEDEDTDQDEEEETSPTPAASSPMPTPSSTSSPTPTPTPTPSASPTSSTSSGRLPSGALTFYALGDSLTEGDRDEHEMGGYPLRLQNRIETLRPGSRVISIGRSGNDSGNLVEGQLSTAVSARPDAALVLIGSNDMWVDCWNDNDTSAGTIANYNDNMETIMSRLHSAGIKIFVGLVDDQARRTGAAAVCESATGRQRMTRVANGFNDIIRTKARTYNATIVDFYNSTIFYSAATLSDDGNHPNAAGYDAMANLWWNSIRPQL